MTNGLKGAPTQKTLSSPLFLGGFNLVALLVLFLLFSGPKGGAENSILLTSGEWAPYTGEQLANQGIASAIVAAVFEHIGYETQVQFLPWGQAQSVAAGAERDADVRGSYPYLRTPSREADFYFSLPIITVPNSVYFNPTTIDITQLQLPVLSLDMNQAANFAMLEKQMSPGAFTALRHLAKEALEQLTDTLNNSRLSDREKSESLQKHYRQLNQLVSIYLTLYAAGARIIPIDGYKYPPIFEELLDSDEPPASTSREAFQRLADSKKPLVVVEASRVAQKTLAKHFPVVSGSVVPDREASPVLIQAMDISFAVPQHLILGKANPENRRLINEFNRQLVTLQNNGTIRQTIAASEYALEQSRLVVLHPMQAEGYVQAYLSDTIDSDYLLITAGTRGVVEDWRADYLLPQSNQPPSPGLVLVLLRQGPHAGKSFFIDGRSIRFQ